MAADPHSLADTTCPPQLADVPVLPPARELPRHVDIVVVGGGTAGAVIAGRLAEAEVGDVALLEAGPDYGPLGAGRWPRDLLDASRLPLSHDWGYSGEAADGRVLPLERARVIGGCSAHNGCTQSSGWRGDYDAWSAAGCRGWSGRELEASFERARRALRVRDYTDAEIQPVQRAFLEAAQQFGVPRTDDLDNLDGGVGVSINPVNIVGGVRYNSSFAYLDPVRDRPRLSVVGHATVDRLEITGDRVTGLLVATGGRLQRIGADLVVLCGGVYGSPEVLMRSGVGDPQRLRAAGVRPIHALPGVGRDVHDHVAVTLRFAGTRRLGDELRAFAMSGWLPEEQCIAKLDSGVTSDGPYDFHVYPWIEHDPTDEHGWQCVFPVGLLRPRSRGSVSLRSTDPMVRAHVDHAYLSDGTDAAALAAALTQLEELCAQPALAGLIGPPTQQPPRRASPDVLREWLLRTHEHYWHPVGGCRMGTDDLAVVDHIGAVRGLSGVRVADGSVFPDAPRATPALPTVALAERMAELLLADLSTTALLAATEDTGSIDAGVAEGRTSRS